MITETIELEVDPETARRYREAEAEDRERVVRAAVEELGEKARARARLFRSIAALSEEARGNGLTQEIVEDILHG